MRVIDSNSGERYQWGAGSEGWHLLNRADLSIIQERVPPGDRERRLEVPPGAHHQFINESSAPVTFLVVSAPHSHGDRTNV